MFWLKLLRFVKHPVTREIALAVLAVVGSVLLEKRKNDSDDE